MVPGFHDQINDFFVGKLLQTLPALVEFLIEFDARFLKLLVGAFRAEINVEVLAPRNPDMAVNMVQPYSENSGALYS